MTRDTLLNRLAEILSSNNPAFYIDKLNAELAAYSLRHVFGVGQKKTKKSQVRKR